MHEPRWVPRLAVEAAHLDQIREHGGVPGVRDDAALDSALARARQKWAYGESPDIAVMAAAYGFGLARNHPFVDGNKRIAFLAIVMFLDINGHEFETTEIDVVQTMLALSAGRMTEEQLAVWIRRHTVRVVRRGRSTR
jgi:death-on-curing protein